MTGQAWVWVVLAIVAVALAGLAIFQSRRGSAADDSAAPAEEAPAQPAPAEEGPAHAAATDTAPTEAHDADAPAEPDPVPAGSPATEASAEPAPDAASGAETNGAVPAEAAGTPEPSQEEPPQERVSDPALAALDSGSVAEDVASAAATRTLTHPGSAPPNPDGSAPSNEYTIKAVTGSNRFHDAGSPVFTVLRADLFFRDAEDASAAGFVHWKTRRQTAPAAAETPAAEAPAPATAAPDDAPRGSAPPTADGSPPEGHPVKANAGSKRYHDAGSPYYSATRADLWFQDGDAAEAAGFVHWKTPR